MITRSIALSRASFTFVAMSHNIYICPELADRILAFIGADDEQPAELEESPTYTFRRLDERA